MSRLPYYTLFVFLLVLLALMSHSCANIGTISGGPKDSIPPVVIDSRPIIMDTGYKDDQVVIYFNEYFDLKEINQEFIASPPFKETPDFKIKKRSLHVKFKEPLQDSVTYSLKFGNAIVDYNEGNILENYHFVFSTKSDIDSFSIGGNLKNAFDLKTPESAFVMIFKNNDDSIPYKNLPDYIAKIDTAGKFSIDYIQPGAYKIFALGDLNTNKLADDFEPRAFIDSLIIPERNPFTKIDSIKAGTILHDIIDPLVSDSLVNDTVVITNTYKNKPSNLQLYLFEEKHTRQRVLDYSRQERRSVNIAFELPVSQDFVLRPINFQIAPENVVLEKNLTNDTITWWIKDTTVYARDSIELNLLYQTLDSLDQPITANDTLLFEYREKKDKDAWKRKKDDEKKQVKKEYLQLSYLTKENKVDLDKKLRIESPTPLHLVDTSRIRLFEIYDTLTENPKKQEIVKAFRLKKDLLSFRFSRKVVRDFFLYPINFKSENWYSVQAADSNRLYTCQITNPEIASMDTLKLIADFDNDFFFNQIQVLTDTVTLPIAAQKIISRKREKADEIKLILDKPLETNLKLIPDDFAATGNWYSIIKNQSADTLTIKLLDKNISNRDTLTFSIKCFDYFNLNNDSVYFEEFMRITYSEPKQFLVSIERITNNKLNITFNKTLIKDPEIQALNFQPEGNWYQLSKNTTGDSLTYLITDEKISKKDTLALILKYTDGNRRGTIINFSDTVQITRKKKDYNQRTLETKSIKEPPKKETVHVFLPTIYSLTKDSVYIRHRLIDAKWKEGTKYMLRLDSLAFIDIYSIFNQAGDYEFASRSLDYYANLKLNLTNIKANKKISTKNDSTSLNIDNDTIQNIKEIEKDLIPRHVIDSIIGTGQLIVQLLSKDGIIIKEYLITEDQSIKMEFLTPGDYQLKVIFDKNGNGKWDTGDYFRHVQPERVIMSGKIIKLDSKLDTELDWNVGESLIKSCTAD